MKKIVIIILIFIIFLLIRNRKEPFTNNNVKCDENSELYYGKCYKKCKPEYENQDSLCVKKCLGNFKQTKTHCLKNDPILLDKGYDILNDCTNENPNGCYKEGLKFYPLCPIDKKQIGQHCTDICPANMLDQGFGCLRTSYIKEIGKTL